MRIIKVYMHSVPFLIWNTLSIDVFWSLDIRLKCSANITRKWIDRSNYSCI
jgi:hypothetical protein